MKSKLFSLLLILVVCLPKSDAQNMRPLPPDLKHNRVVSGLLQHNQKNKSAAKTTSGITYQRVIAQSTMDNALLTYSDSVSVKYSGFRKSKYDYNNMLFAYNYPYNTTPMFEYGGVFTAPQVMYDTYVHWTINPFAMPAFGLYETSFATYDTSNSLTDFTELFVDSVTNDNRSYKNSYTSSHQIDTGRWFNLNAGVADSAFQQFFYYDTADRLTADSLYELHLGVWRIAACTNYNYDTSGNLTEINHYANLTDTSFLLPLVQQSKYENTYDASGRLTTVYTSLNNGTLLLPYVKDTFEYLGVLNFHSSWRQHQFDGIHGTWWPQYRMEKHVTASKPDTVFHNGWDSIMNSWVPISMDIVGYNADNDPDTMQNYLYNWTSYSAAPDYTTVYYYETFVDTTPVTTNVPNWVTAGHMVVYPNPIDNKLTLSFKGINESSECLLTIYKVNGQTVSRQKVIVAKQLDLPLESLSPGMYLVELREGSTGKRYIEKFIKR